MRIGNRIQIDGPDTDPEVWPWTIWRGHACDEYGNCSIYFKIAFLGGFVLFWEPPSHFQREIMVPEPGEDRWIDKRYYDGWSGEDPDPAAVPEKENGL